MPDGNGGRVARVTPISRRSARVHPTRPSLPGPDRVAPARRGSPRRPSRR